MNDVYKSQFVYNESYGLDIDVNLDKRALELCSNNNYVLIEGEDFNFHIVMEWRSTTYGTILLSSNS